MVLGAAKKNSGPQSRQLWKSLEGLLAQPRPGDPVPAGLCGGERGARQGAARGDMPVAPTAVSITWPVPGDTTATLGGLDCSISPRRHVRLEISAGDLLGGLLPSRARLGLGLAQVQVATGRGGSAVMVRACIPTAVSLPREPQADPVNAGAAVIFGM